MKKLFILVLILSSQIFATIESEIKAERFQHKNGVLIDTWLNQIWQDQPDNINFYDVVDAVEISRKPKYEYKIVTTSRYCEKLNLFGKNNWRLPKRDELIYIYNNARDKFRYLSGDDYWTDELVGRPIPLIAVVDKYSNVSKSMMGYKKRVRCVSGKIMSREKIIKTAEKEKKKRFKEKSESIYNKYQKINDIKKLIIFLNQYQDIKQSYYQNIQDKVQRLIKNIYTNANKKNHLKSIKALSEISNQYKNNDMKNFTLSLLNKILNQYKTIDGYFLALDTLNEDTPNIKNIADELVKQIWIQVIEPSHDLQATIKFIREFKDANGAVISKAYDRAILLSNKELDKKYKKLVDSKTSFFFIKANQEEKEKIKEKIARQLFIEAVQSKDNGDEVTFSIKYHIATNNKLFKQTESAFNLYRDKEMKRFFQEQFKSLKDATRQSSSKIIDKLDEVNKKLDSLDETMSSSPTEAEIYEENRKFLMQSYLFDKAMKTHDGDE